MAGVSIPLTPAVHQMISVGPCPQLAEREGEISFPIVRDMDTFCYERQHGADMEVGSYAHRPILHEPEEIPSIEQAKLSPTELPFTSDDFDPQLEQAYELMPELLGAEGAEIRYAINGLLSLTRDGAPVLGETPRCKGLWSAAAVWIKEGPGVGRAVAEWMTHGCPRSTSPTATSRGSTPTRSAASTPGCAPARRSTRPTGSSTRPSSTSPTAPQRLAPMHESAAGARAPFLRGRRAGSGRSGTSPTPASLEEYGDAVMPREHEWDSRWWSPIINAEHLRMREAAGIVDLSARSRSSTSSVPARSQPCSGTCVAQCDVAGRQGRSTRRCSTTAAASAPT